MALLQSTTTECNFLVGFSIFRGHSVFNSCHLNHPSHRNRIVAHQTRSLPRVGAASNNAATAAAPTSMAAAAEILRTKLEESVLAEAEEQRQQFDAAYSKASDKSLIKEGLAITGLKASAEGRLFGELVWKLQPANPNTALPKHKFKSGGNVNLRSMGFERSQGLEATVLEVSASAVQITVSAQVAAKLTKLATKSLFRMEQGVQDVTTKRQMAALAELSQIEKLQDSRRQQLLRAILLNSQKGPLLAKEPPEWMLHDPTWVEDAKIAIQSAQGFLNTSQMMAVVAGLTRTFTLWQGPPGTGKTRTLLAYLTLLCKLASKENRSQKIGTILAVADTNAAADNLLQGLLERKIRVVRVGRPVQVRPELRHVCLDAVAERSSLGQRASALRDQAATMMTRVQAAAAQGQVSDREVQQAQREAQRLWVEADKRLSEAEQAVLDSCQIVVGTCSSAGEGRLTERQFKVVAIDEATQATEPSTLVALTKGAECVVLAGDHAQLPPTVISRTAMENGLDVPLFARLQKCGIPALILNTQYRMHPQIAAFPSQQFYSGAIASGVNAEERPIIENFDWPKSEFPVAFIVCNSPEERSSSGPLVGVAKESGGGSSYRNPGQAEVAVDILKSCLDSTKSIAILTPYNGQVRLLNSLLQSKFGSEILESGRVVVSTVDGFQGREADLVIFATVRCNFRGNVGFLDDARRMNVAITRARRGLIIIGAPRTLINSQHWAAWLNYIKENNLVIFEQQ